MSAHIAVVGSGIAGVTFAEEFRKLDRNSYVTLMTRETGGYYSRPLLSHGFSRGDIETKIILKTFTALVSNDIGVESGADVLCIDRASKTLHYRLNHHEKSLRYDKLVLATGSAAQVPAPFRPQTGLFHALNSLEDLVALRRLRAKLQSHHRQPRWAVVGGGLIGCEIAADLAQAGDHVTLFHALPRLMERQLVEADSARLLAHLRDHLGIEVLLEQAVQGFAGDAERGELTVRQADGERTGFQAVLLACGFAPRIELAQTAGLETRRGIAVDDRLTTTDPDIYAIGDVAELPDGKIYAYVTPVRNQALWLAKQLTASDAQPGWQVPTFKPKAKVPGFEALHPYLF